MSDKPPQDGGPAFPRDFILDTSKSECQWLQIGSEGMSLRDYFVRKALLGLLSKLPLIDQDGMFGPATKDKIKYNRDVAESCYWIADAMLTARKTNIK